MIAGYAGAVFKAMTFALHDRRRRGLIVGWFNRWLEAETKKLVRKLYSVDPSSPKRGTRRCEAQQGLAARFAEAW